MWWSNFVIGELIRREMQSENNSAISTEYCKVQKQRFQSTASETFAYQILATVDK